MDTSYQIRKMDFDRTNGVICDKNGNLLFSCNGIWIANANNDTMVNGSDLNPSYVTSVWRDYGLTVPQANLIIPFSGDSSKYYLFHQTVDHYGGCNCAFYLYYSIIDMSLDGGNGAVIEKNHILLTDSLIPGMLTACKHANGRDWWVIAHQYNTNRSFKYLITPAGIQGPDTQSIGSVRTAGNGQAVFSPDGKKYAYQLPKYIQLPKIDDLDIFDFDRCTGNFYNPVHVQLNDSAYLGGAAFSPNSQILYVSSQPYVYQFDMNAADIPASKKIVAAWDSTYSPDPPLATTFFQSQLAPDGKIYINCANGTYYLHVINNPDVLGLGCDVCQHCVTLPAYNALTIANHPNYFLGAESGSLCDTLTGMKNLEMQNAELNIYPNPSVTENITFTYNASSEAGVINIYNTEGKGVIQYSIPQWSSVQHLKLPKISSGVYMAMLIRGNAFSKIRFVKN